MDRSPKGGIGASSSSQAGDALLREREALRLEKGLEKGRRGPLNIHFLFSLSSVKLRLTLHGNNTVGCVKDLLRDLAGVTDTMRLIARGKLLQDTDR